MSYEPLDAGELAAVVTYLELADPLHGAPPASDLRLDRIHPDPAEYRKLFQAIGERWLWFSRLVMDDLKLAAIIRDPNVELYAVLDSGGNQVGMLELDFREAGNCEIAFLGLLPDLAGRGRGRWLLAEAVHRALRPGTARVHVHTCSLDHPAALAAYVRAGFRATRREVERFPDPRLLGVLPPDCAPQVPLLGTLASAPPSAS